MSDIDKRIAGIIAAENQHYDETQHFDMVGLVANIKQAFAEAGYDRHDWSITPGSVLVDGVPHMTGAEWYERFVTELDNIEGYKGSAGVPHWIHEAARRAAGLDT